MIEAALHHRSYPLFLGVCVGLLLAGTIAVFAPATDVEPGGSRVLMAAVASILLVPVCIATAYAGRSAFHLIPQFPVLRRFWVFAALVFTVVTTIEAIGEGAAARRFASEGRSVDGRVIEIHPEDHDRLLVAYAVSGVGYRRLSGGPRVARSYQSGEAIRVYYFATAPADALFVEPRWQPGLLIVGWLVAAGVLPLWMIGILGSGLRYARKASIQPRL